MSSAGTQLFDVGIWTKTTNVQIRVNETPRYRQPQNVSPWYSIVRSSKTWKQNHIICNAKVFGSPCYSIARGNKTWKQNHILCNAKVFGKYKKETVWFCTQPSAGVPQLRLSSLMDRTCQSRRRVRNVLGHLLSCYRNTVVNLVFLFWFTEHITVVSWLCDDTVASLNVRF